MENPSGPGGPNSFSPFQDLEPGFLAGSGRYTLKSIIGSGAGAVVWLAHDHQLGEDLALKFLAPELADEALLAALRGELARTRKLTHPSIVRIHDARQTPGEFFLIAMDYVAGPDMEQLRRRHDGEVFSWEFSRPLAEQACAALDYAHAEGVLHGGLHPANLLLDPRGWLKITDFGLASVLASHDPSQLPFLSPQQLEGNAPTPADDIYSLGALLYLFLTGTPPFAGGDVPHQIRRVRPEHPEERLMHAGVANEIPAHISAAIMACLAKDPAERPTSAGSLAAQLSAPAPAGKPAAHPSETLSLVPPPPNEKARTALDEAEAFERSLPPEPEPAEEDSCTNRHWGKLAAALALLAAAAFWALRPDAVTERSSRTDQADANQTPAPLLNPGPEELAPSVLKVIQVGSGPAFSYRYQPREAMALDTNAINFGVKFLAEGLRRGNCCYIMTLGDTNNSVGTVTYDLRAAPGYLIQDLRLVQQASLFTAGRIRGEFSTDGGESYQVFFSTPPYTGQSFGYGPTARLNSLNASNVVIRYILHRYTGNDYNLQFLRDCDDSASHLEFSGSIIPAPRP